MIERFTFELFHCNGGDMTPDAEGEYVSYEDYAALQQKLDALAAENAALRNVLEDIIEPQSSVLEREHRIRAENALKAQATDTYLKSVRAEGVDMFGDFAGQQYQLHEGDKVQQKKWKSVVFLCCQYAEQLRSGTHDTADKAG